jgi:hypothetical protein
MLRCCCCYGLAAVLLHAQPCSVQNPAAAEMQLSSTLAANALPQPVVLVLLLLLQSRGVDVYSAVQCATHAGTAAAMQL